LILASISREGEASPFAPFEAVVLLFFMVVAFVMGRPAIFANVLRVLFGRCWFRCQHRNKAAN
jgi:hypothetical protein